MLRKRIAGEVENVALEIADAAVAAHALVDEIADPFGLAAVIQADLAIGIPAGVIDPAAKIARQAGHGIGVVARSRFLEVEDLGFKALADRLVRIEREDPIV